MTFGSTLSLMNRTEPSAKEKFVPPGWWPKMPFRSSVGSTSQSSGLVQTTARSSLASTTKIVFEVPSVTFCDLDPLRAREDRRLAARGQVGRLAEIRALRAHARAAIGRRNPVDQRPVVRAVPGLVEVELLVECLLLEVGENQHPPAQERLARLVNRVGRRKRLVASW